MTLISFKGIGGTENRTGLGIRVIHRSEKVCGKSIWSQLGDSSTVTNRGDEAACALKI